MNDPTQLLTAYVRLLMSKLASFLNTISGGMLKPAHITTLSLLGHFVVVWALWTSRPIGAALAIAVFGLMDALDGALAREQKTVSKLGMYYDAVTDRLKEILIYVGLAVFVNGWIEINVWAIPAVVGTSLLVSYVKAKGEMAVSHIHDKQALNKAFSNGLARYEVRMFLLIAALLTAQIPPILNLIIALNLATASLRFMEISQLLHDEDQKPRSKKA